MPSKSQKQHNLMAMVANDPKAAKRLGIAQKVGEEFMKADKGRKFGSGGMGMGMGMKTRQDLQKINRKDTKHGKMELFKGGGEMKESKAMMKKEVSFMKKKGAPKSMIKHEESEMKGMKKGGKAMGKFPMTSMGKVKTAAPSRDGVAVKGKTKGKMITMKRGGKAC